MLLHHSIGFIYFVPNMLKIGEINDMFVTYVNVKYRSFPTLI
jgi:hypothetical protein